MGLVHHLELVILAQMAAVLAAFAATAMLRMHSMVKAVEIIHPPSSRRFGRCRIGLLMAAVHGTSSTAYIDIMCATITANFTVNKGCATCPGLRVQDRHYEVLSMTGTDSRLMRYAFMKSCNVFTGTDSRL